MGAAHAKPCGISAANGIGRAYSERAGNADPPRALLNLSIFQITPWVTAEGMARFFT